MDHASHVPQTSDRPLRIPRMVWFLATGLLAALVAILIFNVPLSIVSNYALLAFILGGHFFMHGSHGGHGGHADRRQPARSTTGVAGPAATAQPEADEHAGHAGGCH